uniref:DH domain-containing protein n=1 Tax=Gopherus evgoodei TaxID=1825980 RepID=A0A8C4YEE1_9SAUR
AAVSDSPAVGSIGQTSSWASSSALRWPDPGLLWHRLAVGGWDQGRDKAPGHAPAREGDALRVNQLHNSNNNASLGGWLGRRGSRSLSPFGPRASVGANHKLSYLERVVLELVESERTYVQDLRSIVEVRPPAAKLPLKTGLHFGGSLFLPSELLQDLDSCDSNPVAVARCFVDRSQDFDIYTQYCNNYPSSVAVLTECMRNKHQAKFFRERQEQIGHALPLGSYLLKPVQRILKYHLLLQEIAKHFDLEEAGYEVVEEAIDTMTCVAWYINDMKRRHEHAVRLQVSAGVGVSCPRLRECSDPGSGSVGLAGRLSALCSS